MAISTEVNARKHLNIQAGVDLQNDFPLYAKDEVIVFYGNASLKAIEIIDYSVTLNPDSYDQFTITPTQSLIDKINALIALDNTETNRVVVRRVLDYKTTVTKETVRLTAFLSREIERIMMRFHQVNEKLAKSLTLSDIEVGDINNPITIDPPQAGTVLVYDAVRRAFKPGPTSEQILSANDDALQVAADKLLIEGYKNEVQAAAAQLPQNNYGAARAPLATDDNTQGYSVGSSWVNTAVSPADAYLCTSSATGAATWEETLIQPADFGSAAFSEAVDFAPIKASSYAIDGLEFSNNVMDSAHDIDIQPGSAYDHSKAKVITLTSSRTKQLDSTFVEGTNVGGFAAEETLPVNGTIHIWLIAKADGTTDILANNHAASALSPVLPVGFTLKRRVASLTTDGSANILGVSQYGDRFYYNNHITEVHTAPGVRVPASDVPLKLPHGVSPIALLNLRLTSAGSGVVDRFLHAFIHPAATSPTQLASVSNNYGAVYVTPQVPMASVPVLKNLEVVQTSGPLDTGYWVLTLGWIDERKI
jgi:hypothetical protein